MTPTRAMWRSILVPLVGLAIAAGIVSADELDAQGRAMLDPLRLDALHPDALIARLVPNASMVVADVGAGPGFLSLPLARAVRGGKVIATDIRADYLATLSRRGREARLSNVETRIVERDRTGLPPSSVDLIILCQVDHYLGDRARYFAELAKALRPNGRIAIINYARYRAADLDAARSSSLRVIDEWAPSPPFFLLVLQPTIGAR